MDPPRPPIVVVVGPTATGKTALALWLARVLRGELVGADSVQIYRGFDIGSAKPEADELKGITHHLIGCVEPDAPVDAARYAALADRAIQAIAERGNLPIVVGGTGLWLRALWRGLVALPPVDAQLRAELNATWQKQGAQAMHARLARVDPVSARQIHPNDRLRVVRALEVFGQTGTALGALRSAHALGATRYAMQVLHVDLARAQLQIRVQARTQQMLARGFAEEVRTLLRQYGPRLRALGSVGYREMCRHVLDGLSVDETQAAIVLATLQYAKRQRTWFAGDQDTPAARTAASLMHPETAERIQAWLEAKRQHR
jgi:tRNA dimethylallyltransferase